MLQNSHCRMNLTPQTSHEAFCDCACDNKCDRQCVGKRLAVFTFLSILSPVYKICSLPFPPLSLSFSSLLILISSSLPKIRDRSVGLRQRDHIPTGALWFLRRWTLWVRVNWHVYRQVSPLSAPILTILHSWRGGSWKVNQSGALTQKSHSQGHVRLGRAVRSCCIPSRLPLVSLPLHLFLLKIKLATKNMKCCSICTVVTGQTRTDPLQKQRA